MVSNIEEKQKEFLIDGKGSAREIPHQHGLEDNGHIQETVPRKAVGTV